jgi:hypothetical protein
MTTDKDVSTDVTSAMTSVLAHSGIEVKLVKSAAVTNLCPSVPVMPAYREDAAASPTSAGQAFLGCHIPGQFSMEKYSKIA